ncbi:hypothetical protein PHLGIDRAFT_116958 [Phlebiopsis gigantea 11061_1 CR5-6]|uniref:Sorting nexin MVP1 n=1 Tax=Phlebiopsis gigantea (strain 11061_1 CR5-6) TaxID=745531 RepID=A0A0C3PPF6_PHLG1|nr:hypothetical protein PHLGIDRAFT_116958 [Phlebiopsis gigantea 11061_1 CR5-6]
MFNTPRSRPNYGQSSNNNFGGSFMVDNPLSNSIYDSDGLDPWSAAPSPAPPPLPSVSTTSGSSGFSSVIADATVPAVYNEAFAAVDTANTGETSVNALSRVLGTSGLPASTIDRIVSLVSSRPRVSRLEFFVALALVALAQSRGDLSVEMVAALAQDNALPVPQLDLSSLAAGGSGFGQYPSEIRAPVPTRAYSDDPWSVPKFPSAPGVPTNGSLAAGVTSSISGTGLPSNWWRKQESITVNVLGQQGFILNRYLVYEVSTDRAPPVPRRYSEFVILWDCLVKRYPFRILPSLPPKRLGPDESFIEQRRRGLARFLNFIINHPIIKEDGLLAVFLTEPSFESWRKTSSISYEEESASKRVDQVEEMSIPRDLEDKLAIVRSKISSLIEQWQKICILAERMIKRREAAAVRLPPATTVRRPFMPAHFGLPYFSSSDDVADDASMTSSVFSGLIHPRRVVAPEPQADTARLTNALKVVVEVNSKCWRGDDCELCSGVNQGMSTVASHTQQHGDTLEHRARTLLYSTLEALKGQRDLHIATRDMFIRHDRLSGDLVDKLKKRVETNSLKLEGVKAAGREHSQEEAEKLTGLIERDQAAIASALNRRVFIRACLWHELRVVLHNRENTLITEAVKTFAREERDFSEGVTANWARLADALEPMPYE